MGISVVRPGVGCECVCVLLCARLIGGLDRNWKISWLLENFSAKGLRRRRPGRFYTKSGLNPNPMSYHPRTPEFPTRQPSALCHRLSSASSSRPATSPCGARAGSCPLLATKFEHSGSPTCVEDAPPPQSGGYVWGPSMQLQPAPFRVLDLDWHPLQGSRNSMCCSIRVQRTS